MTLHRRRKTRFFRCRGHSYRQVCGVPIEKLLSFWKQIVALVLQQPFWKIKGKKTDREDALSFFKIPNIERRKSLHSATKPVCVSVHKVHLLLPLHGKAVVKKIPALFPWDLFATFESFDLAQPAVSSALLCALTVFSLLPSCKQWRLCKHLIKVQLHLDCM